MQLIRRTYLVACCLALAVLLHRGHAFAATISPPVGFDAGDAEEWASGAELVWQAAGGPEGNADSFLGLTSTGSGGSGAVPALYTIGTTWTGDYSSAGVTGLAVDLMNATGSPPLELRLVLFGPGSTGNRWTSREAISVPNDGTWRSYYFPVGESELVRVLGGASYEAAISNVVRLMLRHNSGVPSSGGTPLSAQLGIDNIALVDRLVGWSGLDCDQDGLVTTADLECSNTAGVTGELLAQLQLVQGDLDGVGGVAFADFLVLSANFGNATSQYTRGDVDGDGEVGFSDFLVLSAHFGTSFGASTVPEPQSDNLILVCAALAGPLLRRGAGTEAIRNRFNNNVFHDMNSLCMTLMLA